MAVGYAVNALIRAARIQRSQAKKKTQSMIIFCNPCNLMLRLLDPGS